MRAKGYEIKGESLAPDAPKYIAFKPAGAERFVRGSERTLGSKYTREEISKRIESNARRKVSFPKDPLLLLHLLILQKRNLRSLQA